ncbi:hypothetical protein TNCV_33511 [Trichonephila clavipes]|nr:hypothetical protein TNCV_33511 [Trichonephila clavipes]
MRNYWRCERGSPKGFKELVRKAAVRPESLALGANAAGPEIGKISELRFGFDIFSSEKLWASDGLKQSFRETRKLIYRCEQPTRNSILGGSWTLLYPV